MQTQVPQISERLKKVLAELEQITQQIETMELPCNDNTNDFLHR